MQHPGDGWTALCACALVAWCVASAAYQRRLLRPLTSATVRSKRQLEMARSTRDPLSRSLYLGKALHTTRTHRHLPEQARQWHRRVNTPVTVVLALVDLGLAVWGLAAG